MWERIVAEKDKKKPVPAPFWKNGYLQSVIIIVALVGILSSTYLYNKQSTTTTILVTKEETSLVITTPTNKRITNKDKAIVNNKVTTPLAIEKVSQTESLKEEKKVQYQKAFTKSTLVASTNNVVKETTNHSIKISNKSNRLGYSKGNNNLLATSRPLVTNELIKNIQLAETEVKPSAESMAMDVEASNHYNGEISSSTSDILTHKMVSKTLADSKKNITTIHLPTTSNKNWHVELYASPDFDTKKVRITNANKYYAQALDTTQKLSTGFTVGLRIAKNISNHLTSVGTPNKHSVQHRKCTSVCLK
jgi:hypothetical protein